MRRLEGPDPPRKPVEQLEPIRLIPEQRLTEVHVRLDQAGDDRFSRAVDLPGSARRPERAHPGDPVSLDQQIALEDAPPRIHGHQGAAAEDDHPADGSR